MNFFKPVDQSGSRVKFQQIGGGETQSDGGVDSHTSFSLLVVWGSK